MRDISHWSARYMLDRVRVAAHDRRHRNEPWLTAEAVHLLDRLLRPTDRCFEWGSGRSTAWLAERTADVHSVEHDPRWHSSVCQMVAAFPHASVELAGVAVESYVRPIRRHQEIDVVLVDGLHRDACALAALDRLAPAGMVVIDNVERYLPSTSRAPEAIGDIYASDAWRLFADRTHLWRQVWTTNGVSDTAVFFRA